MRAANISTMAMAAGARSGGSRLIQEIAMAPTNPAGPGKGKTRLAVSPAATNSGMESALCA